jgi:hypothetical protein
VVGVRHQQRGAVPRLTRKAPLIRRDQLLFVGGAKEDRTPDLYNAIVALSQLSYGPMKERYRTGAQKSSKRSDIFLTG